MKNVLEVIKVGVNSKKLSMYLPAEYMDKFAPLASMVLEIVDDDYGPKFDGVENLTFTQASALHKDFDATDKVVSTLIHSAVKNPNIAKFLNVPKVVCEKFKHNHAKWYHGDNQLWTRNGVITFPIDCGSNGLLHLTEDSLTFENSKKFTVLYPNSYGPALKLIAETIILNYPYTASNADLLFTSNIGAVCDVETELLQSWIHKSASTVRCNSDSEEKKELDLKIADTVKPEQVPFYPMVHFKGIGYVGEGKLINTRTNEFVLPECVDGELYYIVKDYLGVDGNTVKFPFSEIQACLDATSNASQVAGGGVVPTHQADWYTETSQRTGSSNSKPVPSWGHAAKTRNKW